MARGPSLSGAPLTLWLFSCSLGSCHAGLFALPQSFLDLFSLKVFTLPPLLKLSPQILSFFKDSSLLISLLPVSPHNFFLQVSLKRLFLIISPHHVFPSCFLFHFIFFSHFPFNVSSSHKFLVTDLWAYTFPSAFFTSKFAPTVFFPSVSFHHLLFSYYSPHVLLFSQFSSSPTFFIVPLTSLLSFY